MDKKYWPVIDVKGGMLKMNLDCVTSGRSIVPDMLNTFTLESKTPCPIYGIIINKTDF